MKRALLATSVAFPIALVVAGTGVGCGDSKIVLPDTDGGGASSGASSSGNTTSSTSSSSSGSNGTSSSGSGAGSSSSSSSGGNASSSGTASSSGASSSGGSSSSSGGSSSSSGGGSTSSGSTGDSGGYMPDGGGPMDMLNNQQWLLPCGPDQSYSKLVCQNTGVVASINYNATMYGGTDCGTMASAGNIMAGTINRNQTVTVGGNPATTYMVTAHFVGIVEPKVYQGGTKQSPTTATDGWYVDGTPRNSGSYNVYMLGVSSPQHVYYLNALGNQNPAVAEFHYTYQIDFEATFPVQGGAKVQFLADDSNCSAIKNCGTAGSNDAAGICVGIVIPNLVATPPIDQRGTMGYSGQFIVMTITSVSPAQ